MKQLLTLTLAALALPASAFAAGDALRVDFSAGTTQQQGAGSDRDLQFTLSYPIKGGLSVELTAGRTGAEIEAPDFGELLRNLPSLHQSVALDHRIGLGLRYDFAVDQPVKPFLRAGYMQYRGDYYALLVTAFPIDEGILAFQTEEYQTSIDESSWYVAAGARYELGGGWDVNAQVQYSPVRFHDLDVAQTSAQLGMGYRF